MILIARYASVARPTQIATTVLTRSRVRVPRSPVNPMNDGMYDEFMLLGFVRVNVALV